MPSLRLQANPVDALAANLPAITPKKRLRKASTSISPPYIYTLLMSCPLIPSSIILAVTNGMRISIKTSAAVNTGVSIESFLYSPTCPSNVLTILFPPYDIYRVFCSDNYTYLFIHIVHIVTFIATFFHSEMLTESSDAQNQELDL